VLQGDTEFTNVTAPPGPSSFVAAVSARWAETSSKPGAPRQRLVN